MKKLVAICLFLVLLLPALTLAEESSSSLSGPWYGEVQGLIVQLTLNADGTYTVLLPARPDETVSGIWTEKEGFLYFDDNGQPEINVLGPEALKWIGYNAFLRREAPAVYVPADPAENVQQDLYTGYWTAIYVEVNGAMLSADTLGEPTAALIDGSNAALIGPLTGETVLETTFENGALTWSEGEIAITLAFQVDGLLRLTIAAPEASVKLYLQKEYTEDIAPTPEA